MSEEHLSSQFDTDLIIIGTKVLQMGGLVEAQIARAIHTLTNFDTAVCDQVPVVEREINAFEIEIDGDCNNIIARHQPTARDLRLVTAISETITNLERVGGGVTKVAKRTRRLMQDPFAHALNYTGVDRSGETTATILRHALNAFARLDTIAAVSILQEDKVVGEEFHGFMCELIMYMMEDPRMTSVTLDLLFVTKATRRVGDHTENIAEPIICIVRGTGVRHAGREAPKREILSEGG